MNLKFAVCIVVTMATMARGQMFVPCGPSVTPKPGDPPLPKLPQQFQVHIEANIINKINTRNFKEYYDYPGNRATIYQFDQSTGVHSQRIMNFTSGIAYENFSNGTCKAMFLNESRAFGALQEGSHIKTVNDLLYFGEQMGEVYVQEDVKIRGIPVNHWTSCVNSTGNMSSQFTMDWYFSKETFTNDSVQHAVPIRAVINGTGKRPGEDTPHSFQHYYEFTDFISGPIEDEEHVFQVPVGTVCFSDKAMLQEYPPNVTRHFTTVVENTVYLDGKLVTKTTEQLYMDYASGTYRIDEDKPRTLEKDDFQFHPVMRTYDVKDGLLYIVDKVTHNCTVRSLPQLDFWQLSGPGIPPIMQYFQLNGTKMLNQGLKTWRNMPVYSWGFKNTTSGEIFELLFEHLGDAWIGQPEPGQGPRGAPMMTQKSAQPVGFYHFTPKNGNKPNQTVFQHYVGFTSGHPTQDVFDMSVCYAPGHHYTTFNVLLISAGIGTISVKDALMFYQSEFVAAFKHTVAWLADVSVTRIQAVMWNESSVGGIAVEVSFNLLDNTVAGHHDINTTGIPLDAARAFLTVQIQKADTGPEFKFQTEDNKQAHLVIQKGSLWESAVIISDKGQCWAGSTVVLAIGMFIFGALCDLGMVFVKFGIEVSYRTQK